MQIQLLFFGITRDLVAQSSIAFNIPSKTTIAELKTRLLNDFPKLKNYADFAFAVNENYAENTLVLQEKDVVAIIPPVSGG